MKKKLLFGIVLLISLTVEYTSAQTIYHYTSVATVDPQTGVKSTKSGLKKHIRFINGQACVCDEYGKPYDDKPYSNMYYNARDSKTGNMFHFDFVKKENDINIYHAKYTELWENLTIGKGEWIVVDSEQTNCDLYLYLSQDYSRLNFISEKNNSKKGKSTEILVFELYDTDEINQTTFDALHPTTMY